MDGDADLAEEPHTTNLEPDMAICTPLVSSP